ncbi:hypothetical protein [Reinekea marinisedimentorum]|uniref:Uncharacterized protein n=1 Tax=Reinekea marinisedimentorum TaxID=230495 RepID=A0A4R3I473_9GAMM|nr:hypothetical protein [Reinekea marinisedimentorum]TCS40676.1 hypothetical protein BCF53_10832 [Reinekea marinisedimentorum]
MKIDISKAEGMTTREAVVSASGATLLPAGIALTGAVIRALTKQNIQQVEVNEANAPDNSANLDEQRKFIETLFEPHASKLMRELKECLLKKVV